MPVNYQNGKIYAIRSHQTDKIYIGSTTQTLARRLGKHRSTKKCYEKTGKGKYVTSFKILEYDDAYIELLKEYPCDCKQKLLRKEGKYIRKYKKKGRCVNRCISGRTKSEYQKIYEKINKIRIKNRKKTYYLNNKEKIDKRRKLYREINKDILNQKNKEYRDRTAIYRKEKITCKCGCIVARDTMRKHIKTIKHKKWEENNK